MTFDPKEARALVERLLWLEAQYRDAGRIIAEDFKEAAASLTAALVEIERLREARDITYGLLWSITLDTRSPAGSAWSKARKTLLATMTKEDQARGIEAARTGATDQ